MSVSVNTETATTRDPPQKPHGKYYAVYVKAPAEGLPPSIAFSPVPNTSAPGNYLSLQSEIERTEAVLRVLFSAKGKKEKFDGYFLRLAALARAALQQDHLELGSFALKELQDEIVTRETGEVKNGYIRRLGLWALGFGLPAIGFYLYCRYWYWPGLPELHRFREFISMLVGSFLGTWLSFSIRRVRLSFWDLARLEEDALDPSIRLVFVAGLTVVVGLLLATKAVVVTIGSFNSAFLDSGTTAVLIGCLCGIGEIGLPTAVARRASEFVSVLGGAKGAEMAAAASAAAAAPAAGASAAPAADAPVPASGPDTSTTIIDVIAEAVPGVLVVTELVETHAKPDTTKLLDIDQTAGPESQKK